jgi:hypothetical protein
VTIGCASFYCVVSRDAQQDHGFATPSVCVFVCVHAYA